MKLWTFTSLRALRLCNPLALQLSRKCDLYGPPSTREVLRKNNAIVDNLGILKPYSFVLEDDDKEHLGELYLADDDTIIVGGDLMEDLDQDLDTFLDDLLKEV